MQVRRTFWLICLTGFLFACTTQQCALLSVIFHRMGMPDYLIGYVLAAISLPVIASTLLSGWLVTRYGPSRVAVVGVATALLGFISMQFTMTVLPLLLVSRVLQGAGFGMFLPAAIMMVKTNSPDDQQIYRVGLFTSTLAAPTLFAPALADWYLRHYDSSAFFLIMGLPLATSFLIMTTQWRADAAEVIPARQSYIDVIRDPRLVFPLISIFLVGLLYGWYAAFVALVLTEVGVQVGLFFTVFAVVTLVLRFGLMRRLQRLPQPVLTQIGLLLLAMSGIVLVAHVSLMTAMIAGGLFGGGYGIVHPTVTQWASRPYPVAQQARPVTLVNTVFYVGALIAPIFSGYVGWRSVLATLSALAVVAVAMIRVSSFEPYGSRTEPS